jgi:hypothetical protein
MLTVTSDYYGTTYDIGYELGGIMYTTKLPDWGNREPKLTFTPKRTFYTVSGSLDLQLI